MEQNEINELIGFVIFRGTTIGKFARSGDSNAFRIKQLFTQIHDNPDFEELKKEIEIFKKRHFINDNQPKYGHLE